jgi:quercetin dioxygenase-like cupin family protein
MKIAIAALALLLATSAAEAQDPMSYGVKHLSVLAEDAKVRVLRYAPGIGDKTPMHSHPRMVVYVLKGGRVRYTLPNGTVSITEMKTGQTILRDPVTHADEALDPVEAIIVEIKH